MSISGGEPLLRPDLEAILEFIGQNNVPMVLTTNSIFLSKVKVLELQKLGVVTFQVPLHSPNRATHDYLSGTECWEDSLRALILLKSLRTNVVPVFVATRMNAADFAGVVELCALLGLSELIFNRFVPTGLGLLNQDSIGVPDEEMLIQTLCIANDVAREVGITIHLGMPIDVPESIHAVLDCVVFASCPIFDAQSRFTLDASGNIRLCNQSGLTVGNVLNGGTEVLVEMMATGKKANSKATDYRPCRILTNKKLVSIESARRLANITPVA